jgi:two-component system, OmpR family, phosphate regulon sensor histidine kinase PhoR
MGNGLARANLLALTSFWPRSIAMLHALVRRSVVIYVLVIAVLAAAAGLAYYGYRFANQVATTERAVISDTTRELAEEKVIGIESQIIDGEQKLVEGIQIEPIPNLTDLVSTTGVAVTSVFVLDSKLKILPGGHYSTRSPEVGKQFLAFFNAQILPDLELTTQKTDVRMHMHGTWGDRPYLFSYSRRLWDGVAFYVVIETDLAHLVSAVFPQTFAVRSPRLFQIVDERGDLVYGSPFADVGSGVVIEIPFADTVDKWRLRVAQKDTGAAGARGRRQLVDVVLIALAVTVIVAGLGFLGWAMRRERRANDLKSEFISNVSHELKTPLSIISMFGEMLALGRTKTPAQATEYAEIIWRESVRLGRLIDNVLDFSKMERGQGGYEFSDCDVVDIVTRAIEISQRRLTAAEIVVNSELADDLPLMRLDGNAFTLAVLNLIDNAIKYAAQGKRIDVSLAQVGKNLVLTVRDYGPGIDADEHTAIFGRFYRAKAVRLLPIRGSGIGLALVQHIVRAHNGDIKVETPDGGGSRFVLTVPAVEVAAT